MTPLPILISREVVFVQEIPSSTPITSYMDTICRPLLTQNKIKYGDLRICLIELEYKAETSQTSLRYADSFPFDRLGGWRGVDFPWETMNEPSVDAVLKAMRRKRNWTPGSLTMVIFNISNSSLGFRHCIYYRAISTSADTLLTLILQALLNEIGGENGCILVGLCSSPIYYVHSWCSLFVRTDPGGRPAHSESSSSLTWPYFTFYCFQTGTAAFQGLARLSSCVVMYSSTVFN